MDKEEKLYKQLRGLGQRLHIPTFEAFLELEVRDKDGRVIHHHKQRSHSWVRNAYNALFCQLGGKNASDGVFGAGNLNWKNTVGGTQSGARCLGIIRCFDANTTDTVEAVTKGYYAGAGIDTSGIVVGSGVAAESFEDYALQTQIANGIGAGQLSYIESNAPVKSWNGGTLKMTVAHARYFNNNSGGIITVNEIGLEACIHFSADERMMVARDKLGAGVNIPNTGQLKVTYTIELTYPA